MSEIERFTPADQQEIVTTRMIKDYVRAGELDSADALAQQWLRALQRRGGSVDAHVCSILAIAWANAQDAMKAEPWLERAWTSAGAASAAGALDAVVATHLRAGRLSEAEAWVTRMLEHGVTPSVKSSARFWGRVAAQHALISAYAKARSPERAETLFENMLRRRVAPTVVSYTVLIDAYARIGDTAAAERVFARMTKARVSPSVVSYNTVAKAFAKAGKPSEAEALVMGMARQRLAPTAESCTAVINGYAERRRPVAAEAVLERMRGNRVKPTVATYGALLGACKRGGDVERAERWLQRMRDDGCRPNVVCYRAVMGACAAAGKPTRAEHWFDESARRGLHPGSVGYNTMVAAWAEAGDLPRALSWIDCFADAGLKVEAPAYGAMIDGHAKLGDLEGATAWFEQMKAHGHVNVQAYNQMIDACGFARPRAPDRAEELLRAMVSEDRLRPTHVTLRMLARVLGRARTAEICEELQIDWQRLRVRWPTEADLMEAELQDARPPSSQ